MALEDHYYRYKFRSGETADIDPDTVLREAEPGVEFPASGDPIFKIGDGVSTWAELSGPTNKSYVDDQAFLFSLIFGG